MLMGLEGLGTLEMPAAAVADGLSRFLNLPDLLEAASEMRNESGSQPVINGDLIDLAARVLLADGNLRAANFKSQLVLPSLSRALSTVVFFMK